MNTKFTILKLLGPNWMKFILCGLFLILGKVIQSKAISGKGDLELKDMNSKFKDASSYWSCNNKNLLVDIYLVNDKTKIDTVIDVKGIVRDEKGIPIPGVTVSVPTKKMGTVTNINGEFVLMNVPKSANVRFSSIGYITKDQIIGGEIKFQNVVLKTYVSTFDEAVVVAYGTTSRRVSTSNFGEVKAKEIEKQPINNPLLSLQGRIPGVVVEQNTGLSGGGVTIRVQGQASLSMGSDPLYVIDGVPFNSQLLPTTTLTLGSSGNTSPVQVGAGNILTYINPADIESITVLKDADATSIYGSRAAAGAILITTKKGKAGPTSISVRAQKGWSRVPRKIKVLNREQYLEMRHEALKNDNAAASTNDFDLNGAWDTTRSTDWQKTLLGGTASFTDIQASISGGKDNTQFAFSTGYHKETSVFPQSLSDTKGSVHFSINHLSENQKFRIQLSGNYLADNNQITPKDLTNDAIRLAPVAPKLFLDDGSINWQTTASGISTMPNPMAQMLYYKNFVKGNNLIASGNIGYSILPCLEVKSTFGFNNLQTEDFFSSTPNAFPPEYSAYFSRSSTFANGYIRSWIIEPQVTFNKRIKSNNFDFLIGTTIQHNVSNQTTISGTGYASDLVLQDIKAAPNIRIDNSIYSVYKYNAIFGRINYNFKEKYIINFSARRDGSSRFGPANRFNNFSSLGLAWAFSNERFIKSNIPFLSFGKLRSSYGTSGNDQIGDYQYITQYNYSNYPVAYQGQNGLIPNGLPNPNLQWEETRKLTLGLDLGFLKDRIFVFINYYRNRSSNQLTSYRLPDLTGFSAVLRNFPAKIQNSGWEFTINSNNINTAHLSWTTGLNLNIARNKLLEFPNLIESSYSNLYEIGKSINIVKLYDFAGVNSSTGLYQFRDFHGNLTSRPDYSTDRSVSIETYPKVTGGLQNTVNFRGFQLDLLLQFVQRSNGRNYYQGTTPGAFSRGLGNQPIYILDRWQKEGDARPIQKFSSIYPGSLASAYYSASSSKLSYSNASYIRLKNISLSYELPQNLKNKIHFKECNLFILGQNLLTFTSYKGLDPETQSVFVLPPLRTITAGIKVTL